MRVDADRDGLRLTTENDERITSIGKFLRRTKLDELPQLVNVIVGEMSLVGPRPEVEEYVELYSPEQKQVLSVRPGVTDPASIVFRHEEILLANQSDPEAFYVSSHMPAKLALNLKYLEMMSLRADVSVVLRTVVELLKSPATH